MLFLSGKVSTEHPSQYKDLTGATTLFLSGKVSTEHPSQYQDLTGATTLFLSVWTQSYSSHGKNETTTQCKPSIP